MAKDGWWGGGYGLGSNSQDAVVISGGAAVFRQEKGAGVLGGVVVLTAVVDGMWLSSLHSSFVGVVHDSGVESDADIDVEIMPEWTGQGSAHNSVLASGESVSMPEFTGHGSAHRLLSVVTFVGVFVVGVSFGAFAAVAAVISAASFAAASFSDSTISLQSMLQVGAMRAMPSPCPWFCR